MSNTQLEWRSVVGYEGLYEISNRGNIRRLPRLDYVPKRGCYVKIKAKELTPTKNTTIGYPVVGFKGKIHYVHRLLALAFIPTKPGATFVNHKNGNKQDNRLSNLEWVSQAENNRHAGEAGLMSRGSSHHWAKLKESDIRNILFRLNQRESPASISKDYPVGEATIRGIKAKKIWKHITNLQPQTT